MAKIRLAAFCYMHLQGSRKRPNLCYTHQFATLPVPVDLLLYVCMGYSKLGLPAPAVRAISTGM
jgi:hypothetical protein